MQTFSRDVDLSLADQQCLDKGVRLVVQPEFWPVGIPSDRGQQDIGFFARAAAGHEQFADQTLILLFQRQQPEHGTVENSPCGMRHFIQDAAHIDHRVVFVEDRRHPRLEVVQVYRLGDVIHRTRHHALRTRVAGILRRDQNHRDTGGLRAGFQLAAGFDAVNLRHHHVQQDQVRAFPGRGFNSFQAV